MFRHLIKGNETMTPKTNYSQPVATKSPHYGWQVVSYLEFDQDRKIKIMTMKSLPSGNLDTTATVVKQYGLFELFDSTRIDDYSATIVREKVRVTEKAAMLQHMETLANRDSIVEAAHIHYAKQVA